MKALDDRRTGYVDANGLRFACQRHPEPDKAAESDTIVLIRGLGTQMIEWSPVLIESLTRGGLKVVIFDNRDVGLSSKLTSNYLLEDMAADVVAIMDALEVDRFHVFGISLGGMVAQLVGYLHGERVKTLCSVMSTSGDPGLPRASQDLLARLGGGAPEKERAAPDNEKAVPEPVDRLALEIENRALFGSPGYPESEDHRREMSIRVFERCYYPAGVARQMQAVIADGSRVERLQRIESRTLVIHGADDPLIPLACGEHTARHIPGAEFQVVAGMGHNIPDTLSVDIAARVLDFIID